MNAVSSPDRPPEPRRRSMRLGGFDYAEHGAYFVTICTRDRVSLFGTVVEDVMRLNGVGTMIERWWAELPTKFPDVETDAFVVMPNHVHGLLFINGDDATGARRGTPNGEGGHTGPLLQVGHAGANATNSPHGAPNGEGGHTGPPLQVTRTPLPRIMQWFKTMTTNEYLGGVRNRGWPPVSGKLWQRGYYDHIVRNNEALNDIRQYIIDNPRKWSEDEHNPSRARY